MLDGLRDLKRQKFEKVFGPPFRYIYFTDQWQDIKIHDSRGKIGVYQRQAPVSPVKSVPPPPPPPRGNQHIWIYFRHVILLKTARPFEQYESSNQIPLDHIFGVHHRIYTQ